jgi:hypothetical protein
MKLITTIDLDGEATKIEVEFTYLPGYPGCTSGPPERCHEYEDEDVEIHGISVTDTKRVLDINNLSVDTALKIVEASIKLAKEKVSEC